MTPSPTRSYRFEPHRYEPELLAMVHAIEALDTADQAALEGILRLHPKDGRGFFSKSEIVRGLRYLIATDQWRGDEAALLDKIRMKPIRTLSGVAPVTVLTKPYPCPGACIFCPSDVRMPKSYLSDEPGAQRAAQHQFDPYLQTLSRLLSYRHTGHRSDKVELIILGGTWSSYPEGYQVWFVKRCFDALNDFSEISAGAEPDLTPQPRIDFRTLAEEVDGRHIDRRYNEIVKAFDPGSAEEETASWAQLGDVQRRNEGAGARCIGLVVETRPDHLTLDETIRLRRLGTTKVQIGIQSLSDDVLRLNRRGHDVAATHRALHLLRQAGFKIHAHWMPNLYGSSPEADVVDYRRLFADPGVRPDELKIYPCSLIESAELMAYHDEDRWRPYDHDELLATLASCMLATPEYCRLTRIIRDIPGTDIVAGNKLTNFRQIVEAHLEDSGRSSRDIRSREVRGEAVARSSLELRETEYASSVGREIFLQFVTPEDRLAAFLRLALPSSAVAIDEISTSAMIREVHTYGRLVKFGARESGPSQHLGLGQALIERAAELARAAGFADLAVISSVGTRHYYRRRGFEDGPLYQHRAL